MSETKPKKRREGGFAKVDNGLRFSKFRAMPAINQKNYFTEYLKRDNQLLVNRDAASAAGARREGTPRDAQVKDEEESTESEVSRMVVLHLGSRNMRIGFASEVYPKTIPSVLAKKQPSNKDSASSEGRVDGLDAIISGGEDFEEALALVRNDFKERMKFYKRRIVPNGEEIVRTFNSRQKGEDVLDPNDPDEDEQEDGPIVYGKRALSLDDEYRLYWPIQFGSFNESDYQSPQSVLGDIYLLLLNAFTKELGINPSETNLFRVVVVIPDLYQRRYVINLIEILLKELKFGHVAIIQESVAASFGAGISSACIIDIGAQTTKVSCVDDGMVVPDSRVVLNYGGDDITAAHNRMLLEVNFPYKTIDLHNSYDWELADSLKIKHCTVNDTQIAVQLYSFYYRRPGAPVIKYDYKTYEEVMLPVLGLFYPELFAPTQKKLSKKFKLFPRSQGVYDMKNNDPVSDAMLNLSFGTLAVNGESYEAKLSATDTTKDEEGADVENDDPDPDVEMEDPGPVKGVAPSSSPRAGTPMSVQENGSAKPVSQADDGPDMAKLKQEALSRLSAMAIPDTPLDHAIIESITRAVATVPSTTHQVFYENLMVVGGGGEFAGFHTLLTDRLGMWTRKMNGVDTGDITVNPVPREIDPAMISWKGGCVFGKLKITDELWICESDWEFLGSRLLQYKVLFNF